MSEVIREYHFELEPRTWNQSKLFCDTYYDGLATIITQNDLNRATFSIPTIIGQSISSIWIGLNDIQGEWLWDDGTQCIFNTSSGGHDCSDLWYLWSPNIHGLPDRHCSDLWFREHWVFGDRTCEYQLPFICNSKYEYNYIWTASIMNWTDAEIYCNNNHNGLATIRTSDDYLNAIQAISPQTDRVWIGLHDSRTANHWQWSNGDKCNIDRNFTHDCSVYWKYDEPNNNDHCAEMQYYEYEETWLLNGIACNSTASVLCIQSDTAPHTKKPKADITNDVFALSLTARSWAESVFYCEENYNGLASILSEEELAHAAELIPNNVDVMTYKEVWIGLSDIKQQSMWLWSDGASCVVDDVVNNMSVCTDLWNVGEPNNWYEREHCGEIRYTGASLGWRINDFHCDYALPALCRKDKAVTTANPVLGVNTYSHAYIVNNNTGHKSDDHDSKESSFSTLERVLIITVAVLLFALSVVVFCCVRLKKIYRGIGEMDNYVKQQGADVMDESNQTQQMQSSNHPL